MMLAMRLMDRMLPILSAHFDKRLVFESNQLIEIFRSFYSFHIISLFFDYIFAAKILFFRINHPKTILLLKQGVKTGIIPKNIIQKSVVANRAITLFYFIINIKHYNI